MVDFLPMVIEYFLIKWLELISSYMISFVGAVVVDFGHVKRSTSVDTQFRKVYSETQVLNTQFVFS